MKSNKIDFSKIKRYRLKERQSKVNIDDFAKVGEVFLASFLDLLPNILAAKDLKEIIDKTVTAYKKKKTIVFSSGAHTIKVGLSPLIIELLRKNVISALTFNGACLIHDFEIAYCGSTSEDVGEALKDGKFGMSYETGKLLNEAIVNGVKKGFGLGKAVGEMIASSKFKYKNLSILGRAYELGIPVNICVALGTDIIHVHPQASGEYIGKGAMKDFKDFCSIISNLEGGVYFNVGSAVLLPEYFLKALSAVRNLGFNVKNFTAVNFDFIRQYRSITNVVKRPTASGGKGYSITGHNEIMLPLLIHSILEKIK